MQSSTNDSRLFMELLPLELALFGGCEATVSQSVVICLPLLSKRWDYRLDPRCPAFALMITKTNPL